MKKPSIDQGAQASGAVLAILGVFDAAAKMGITADDLAIVLGSLATLAGIVRHWWEKRKADGADDA
jgi:hypothetical protein